MKWVSSEFIKELEDTAIRIEDYLESYEIDRDSRTECKKKFDNDEQEKMVYWQQRAKLTAYLYVLDNLGSKKLPQIILNRRGFEIIDEKKGVFVDNLNYPHIDDQKWNILVKKSNANH